ncbi:hypothetical protein AB0F52_30960 [Amycolatopsis sp. NPDC024027]|uniref:hypothetical protein n=1 Tax=Amycolatopsis sp. NPDC024027 TaxID=3154327 RepID=UPI0033D75AAC
MANLADSRNKFYAKHKLPKQGSFWYEVIRRLDQLDNASATSLEFHRTWRPDRSNCPELTSHVEHLIDSLPAEWRAAAKSIFVGRIINAEANAQAWTERQAGIIEINLQYTYILNSYVVAFDEFTRVVRTLIGDIVNEQGDNPQWVERLHHQLYEPWDYLDSSRQEWIDSKIIGGTNRKLTSKITAKRRATLEVAEESCEMFIVGHELAHHLLGHTTSSSKNRKAKRAVDEAIQGADIWNELIKLTLPQKREIHADILSFLMIADSIERAASFSNIYRATLGSTLSLLALTHVNEAWLEDDSASTHPGFDVRFKIISELVKWLSADRKREPLGDHPLGLLAQLTGFCAIALREWLSRRYPDEFTKPHLLNWISWLLDESARIESELPGQ